MPVCFELIDRFEEGEIEVENNQMSGAFSISDLFGADVNPRSTDVSKGVLSQILKQCVPVCSLHVRFVGELGTYAMASFSTTSTSPRIGVLSSSTGTTLGSEC